MTIKPFADEYNNPTVGQARRLIGIEFRVRDQYGIQREVAIFPLDVEIPMNPPYGQRYSYNITVHTDKGDVTTQDTYF